MSKKNRINCGWILLFRKNCCLERGHGILRQHAYSSGELFVCKNLSFAIFVGVKAAGCKKIFFAFFHDLPRFSSSCISITIGLISPTRSWKAVSVRWGFWFQSKQFRFWNWNRGFRKKPRAPKMMSHLLFEIQIKFYFLAVLPRSFSKSTIACRGITVSKYLGFVIGTPIFWVQIWRDCCLSRCNVMTFFFLSKHWSDRIHKVVNQQNIN